MEVRTLKGVDKETWMKFKMLAVKRNLSMGKLLKTALESYEKHADEAWNAILYGERILSDEEAEEMHKVTKKIRKESWERNAPYSDTSIVIELERKNIEIIKKIEELKRIYGAHPKIAFMTYFEILEGIDKKSEKNKEIAKKLIEWFEVIQINKKTAENLVILRKKYTLPIPDLLIAAQTMEHEGILVTRDKDFERIEEIKKIVV